MLINYIQKNGYLFPYIQISNEKKADTNPLGKYGQMCLSYLRAEHPDRYAELLMNGELMPLMHKVNDEAYEQIAQIMGKSMEQYNDNTTDTMLNFRRRSTAKAIAEEIVIKDFVLLPR